MIQPHQTRLHYNNINDDIHISSFICGGYSGVRRCFNKLDPFGKSSVISAHSIAHKIVGVLLGTVVDRGGVWNVGASAVGLVSDDQKALWGGAVIVKLEVDFVVGFDRQIDLIRTCPSGGNVSPFLVAMAVPVETRVLRIGSGAFRVVRVAQTGIDDAVSLTDRLCELTHGALQTIGVEEFESGRVGTILIRKDSEGEGCDQRDGEDKKESLLLHVDEVCEVCCETFRYSSEYINVVINTSLTLP